MNNMASKEYWIVHPSEQIVEVFTLDEQDTYGRPKIFASDDLLPVNLFPSLEIHLASVFGIEHAEKEPEAHTEE